MFRKISTKILPLLLVVAMMASTVVACTNDPTTTQPTTTTITDMAGRTVEIPTDLTRVASVFQYITQIQLALGKGDMLVAIDSGSANNANLASLYPEISDIPAVGSAFNINKESLLLADPQLVITVTWDRDPDKTQEMLGVPVVCLDLDYYKEGIEFLGKVLHAEEQARVFTSYYDEKMDYINGKLTGVAENEKPRVYIGGGDGANSTHGAESTWHFEIVSAGGVNVAADMFPMGGGGSKDVSMEQIILWDPEFIILDQSCPDSVEEILSDPKWQQVSAVKNEHVYLSPNGYLDMFGRPHLESLLSRIWIADKIYGDKVGLDVAAEAKAFYLEFYGKSFSDEEIDAIINPVK